MPTRLVPPLLALAGTIAILALAGTDAWPLLLAWTTATAAVALAARTRRRTRQLTGTALAIACLALTWEGGLFLLPSAIALATSPGE